MITHDPKETDFYKARSQQFKQQVTHRIEGHLTEDEFKPLRLMNGLYLELHAYMLRVGIPYGTLSSQQLHALANVADKFDRGYGHFTTRQNIQLNWLELGHTAEILAELAEVNLHAIQTSGNCIRSVTSDPYAGAAPDEVTDPRPTAELIRQWATLHPEFSFLGRKFKIAVTATVHDRAAIKVHDIGVQIVTDEQGTLGYKIFVGGGLGRTPMVGKTLAEFVAQNDLLAYLEASLRIYNRFGRRDNKYKARIKILTKELGIDQLRDAIEKEFARSRDELPDSRDWLSNVETLFSTPTFEQRGVIASWDDTKEGQDTADPFSRWIKKNVLRHKQDGYHIVNIPLKGIDKAPGDITSSQMHTLADLAEQYSFADIRVTKEQNLVLPHVKTSDLYALWKVLSHIHLAEANYGLITDIVSCPGMDYCALATARSIPVAQRLTAHFSAPEIQDEIGKLSIKISGCINACGHHHVGHIGILGLEKHGKEYYQIVLGGNDGENTSIGKVTGPGFSSDEIVDAVQTIIDTYKILRLDGELFSETQARIGAKPFKEALYDTH
ncbi:MAG: nitrite/sulfite reductase [Gammaproteobacteria bacterium]